MPKEKKYHVTADNLHALRVHYGYAQKEIAEEIGVTSSAISQWERGANKPDADNAMKLAGLYGVSIQDIYGDKDGFAAQMRREVEKGLPILPVVRTASELSNRNGSECRERFVAPPRVLEAHPEAVYVRVPDGRVNRRIPAGYIAMVDTADTDVERAHMYCVCINDEMVFGYLQPLDNGVEVLPDSWDPTVRPVLADYETDAIDVIGRVLRATMPEGYGPGL